MSRPSSVTIASWIWLFCALFTTWTIVNILTATNMLAFLSQTGGPEEDLVASVAITWTGQIMAAALAVAMVVQVIAAVKLRDGAGWARILLAIAAGISLLAVLYDITLITAWILFVANVVALVLAHNETSSDYLAAQSKQSKQSKRSRRLVSA